MRKILHTCILFLVTISLAWGACTEANLVANFERGKILCMQVGSRHFVFEPLLGESFETWSWSRKSKCVIVEDGLQFKVINLDEKRIIDAKQLRIVNASVVNLMDSGKYVSLQVGPKKALFEVTSSNTYESSIWLPFQNCLIVEDDFSNCKLLNIDANSIVEAKLVSVK